MLFPNLKLHSQLIILIPIHISRWEIGVYSQALDSSSLPSSSSLTSSNRQAKQDIKNNNKLISATNIVDQTTIPPQTSAINNHLHPPNHYRTIISNSRIHILENASLVIKDVHKQDQGYYLCQAANNFGSLSSLIKFTVNGKYNNVKSSLIV